MVFGAKRQAYASQTQATNQTHCTRKFVKLNNFQCIFTPAMIIFPYFLMQFLMYVEFTLYSKSIYEKLNQISMGFILKHENIG